MKRKLRSALTLVASLSLLAAACGDDDDTAEPADATGATDAAPADGTTPPADTGSGEDVTLSLLIDNTEVTRLPDRGADRSLHRTAPQHHVRHRAAPGRRRRRQHRQDPAGDRRDERRLLLQLRLAAPGAQPGRDDRRPHRRSVLDNVVEAFLPVGDAGRQGLRRAVRHGHGRRHPLQQEDLRGARARRCPKTWAEFVANNDKIKAAGITPVIATFARHLDLAAVRARRLLQRRTQAEPNFADDYTANKAKYATTPAALQGFEHLAEAHEKG